MMRWKMTSVYSAPSPGLPVAGCVHSRLPSESPTKFWTVRGAWSPNRLTTMSPWLVWIVATAVHCVNSVPYVVAAPPGVQTYLDLPLVAGRAHPDLA